MVNFSKIYGEAAQIQGVLVFLGWYKSKELSFPLENDLKSKGLIVPSKKLSTEKMYRFAFYLPLQPTIPSMVLPSVLLPQLNMLEF